MPLCATHTESLKTALRQYDMGVRACSSPQHSQSTSQGETNGQFNPYLEAELMIFKSVLFAEGVRTHAMRQCPICTLGAEHWIAAAAKKVAENHPPSPHPHQVQQS